MFRENHIIQSMLKGMNAGVAAVIISVVWDMAAGIIASRDLLLIVIMLLAFVANYIFGINVVLIILVTALFGGLYTFLREKKSKKDMKEDLHR
jgi:chromate transporter